MPKSGASAKESQESKKKLLSNKSVRRVAQAYGGDELFPKKKYRKREKALKHGGQHGRHRESREYQYVNGGGGARQIRQNQSSQRGDQTKQAVKNPNEGMLRALTDMRKVERAAGNITVSDAYDEAIGVLLQNTDPTCVIKSQSKLRAMMKGCSKKSLSIVSEVYRFQENQVLSNGVNILDQADAMVFQSREKSSHAFSADSVRKAAMRQRLLVILEEEQEREREREAFWWSDTTQARSMAEKEELAQIFDQERAAAANRIMLLSSGFPSAAKSGPVVPPVLPVPERDDGAVKFSDEEEFTSVPDLLTSSVENILGSFFDDQTDNANQENQDASTLMATSTLSPRESDPKEPEHRAQRSEKYRGVKFREELVDNTSRLAPYLNDIEMVEQESMLQESKPFLLIVNNSHRKSGVKGRKKKNGSQVNSLHGKSSVLKERDHKNEAIVRKTQKHRIRHRPRIVFDSSGKAAASVLDDHDSIGFLRQSKASHFVSAEAPGMLEEMEDKQTYSSGIYWGESLDLVDDLETTLPVERMASTKIGGGVFWRNWNTSEGSAKQSTAVINGTLPLSAGVSADIVDTLVPSGETEKALQPQQTALHAIERLVVKYRASHRGAKLSERIATGPCKLHLHRSPLVGGLGNTNGAEPVGEQLLGDPMFTVSTRMKGSVNGGHGTYGIVTVFDGMLLGKSSPGLKANEHHGTDMILRAYISNSSRILTTRITRAEASILLNKAADWLQASEVRRGNASMQYMRPYWKKKIGPIVSRLQIHQQMIGGESFVSPELYLDIDRCILSQTGKTIQPWKEQSEDNINHAFPKEVAIVIRVERSKTVVEKEISTDKTHVPAPNSMPQGSDQVMFACTVVFRRQNGQMDTLRRTLHLASLTRHFQKRYAKSPMEMVADCQLPEVCKQIVHSLRLAFISPPEGDKTDENGRFRRYRPREAIHEAEIELLFEWQKPKRRAIYIVPEEVPLIPVVDQPMPLHLDDCLEDASNMEVSSLADKFDGLRQEEENEAANNIQRVFRGHMGRVAVFRAREQLQKIREAEEDERRQNEKKRREQLRQEAAEVERKKAIKEMQKLQFLYTLSRELEIDGKIVNLQVQVVEKPSITFKFTAAVAKLKKNLKLSVSGAKLDSFVAYQNLDTARFRMLAEEREKKQNTAIVHTVDMVEDIPGLAELLIEKLQIFSSSANNVSILSIKPPTSLDISNTDVYLVEDKSKQFKTPPRPSNIPKLDMNSVKKSKRRRRRISLGLAPLSAKNKK